MSTAEDLRRRAASIQARDRPATTPAAAAAAPAALPAAVRQTVDITGEQHQALNAWKLETALALGRSRPLTTQDALAAMVAVLLDDESVARRVRARLESP